MDSGNSGSMQSSSTGGDEEYDSRADTSTISAFLNNNNVPPPQPTTTFAPFTHHVLDPLSSNYSDPTQRSHMLWSNVSRSQPHPPHNNQPFLLTQFGGQTQPRGTLNNVGVGVGVDGDGDGAHAFHTTTSTLPPESDEQNSTNTNTNSNMVRNPKKRSRASRRAPTTVLTTDTTNFRAMVQEFTGIPAPPFTSSPFPRTRLDLFASSSSTIRSTSTHNLDPSTPPYLLRPFAHKVQSQPSSIPPMLDTLASNISNNNTYHPLNMHNPILSLLQPPPKYPQQPSLEIPQSGVGFEELGLSHAHVGNAAQHHDHHNIHNNMRAPSSEAWAQAQAQAQRIGNNDGGVLRSLGGGGTLNGKVNYSSDFHGEKGPDCAVAARSEGMVESWINCSSD
ncbi:uncharacterized protein LOC109787733 [Cajanus cajan]|uniref:uncharacterized protein LOC109787733 n=1 Tax=Cajanus cajan TaxID=3821 RepID=UPI00098DA69D|nr:uncharacterized protein LOC109787733 [Cajanus cajan]